MAYTELTSKPGDRLAGRGHDAATGVLTSRTVKVMVRFDEHSARCVARSRDWAARSQISQHFPRATDGAQLVRDWDAEMRRQRAIRPPVASSAVIA
jgi:hypothetical protein